MKKILKPAALIVLLGMGTLAWAQDKPKQKFIIAKGTKAFTGRVNFSYSKPSFSTNQLLFGIGEQEGFFVTNNVSIGTSVGYNLSRLYNWYSEVSFTEIRHEPSLGLNLRYYHMFTERFGFFAQFTPSGGLAYVRNIQTTDVGSGGPAITETYDGFLDIGITPNLVFFVTRKFAVEANFGRLGYRHNFDSGAFYNSKRIDVGVTPSLNIGMSFYLGKGVQVKS